MSLLLSAIVVQSQLHCDCEQIILLPIIKCNAKLRKVKINHCHRLKSHGFSKSDAVVSSLLRHEAHAVSLTGLGELAHFSPLVCIGIIVQHVTQILSTMSPCKTLEYYASLVAAIPHLTP